MPKTKKFYQATEEYKCSFCRGKIVVSERYASSTVKDGYGKYTLRHHVECERTAELNESLDW